MKIRVQISLLALVGCFAAVPLARGAAEKDWAFRSFKKPDVPASAFPVLAWNELDHFIQAALKAQDLGPSSRADKRTLIRRVYFDLIGLPPTPSQIEAFVNDSSDDAWEKLIDELLRSPHYGERWGRYWLDVVHFGETHGYDKDKPRPNAWPYRDYVIHALNSDKPYSRFVQEQLAADVLFPDEPSVIPATGFIAAGPWDFVGHVELPETKMDGLSARYNDRDDMVMNTMSTFMSLTVHCARCHDHKFDPIPTKDYYRLQAVFAGVDRADREFDTDPDIYKQHKELKRKREQLKEELREILAEINSVSSPERTALERKHKQVLSRLKGIKEVPLTSPSNGYHSGIENLPNISKWVQIDLEVPRPIERIVLIPARPTDFPDTPGFGFPIDFRVEISDDEDFRRPILVREETNLKNPGNESVEIRTTRSARFVRVTGTKLWERTKDYVFALGEMQIVSGGTNVALNRKVTAADSIEAGRWSVKYLVDNFSSREPLGIAPEVARAKTEKEILQTEEKQIKNQIEVLIENSASTELKDSRSKTNLELEETQKRLGALPKPQMVYAAAHEFAASGSFHPAKTPREVHLLKRGEVKSPGELMQPGALSCFADLPFECTSPQDEGSRRAALALWLTNTNNLLLRKSIVNRVWQYHFGRGLVDTPNDFGHMGSSPSHPDLLDWLSYWFLENGESLKKLHKLILMSHTWQQRSADNPAFARIDSDNRLLWRMNRTRLDAESLRDSILFVSGALNPRMGGPSDQQFFFKDDHSPVYDYARFDVESPNGHRRSIYRFLVRSAPDPFMEALDCADPSLLVPKRNITLTALQALATLNNNFVIAQTESLAKRLRGECAGIDTQVERAFLLTLSRKPTDEEKKKLSDYATHNSLEALCRLMFNLNEFAFVD